MLSNVDLENSNRRIFSGKNNHLEQSFCMPLKIQERYKL